MGMNVFEGKLQVNGLEMCKTNGHVWYVADSFEEILYWKELLPTHVGRTVPLEPFAPF